MSRLKFRKFVKQFSALALATIYLSHGSSKPELFAEKTERVLAARSPFQKKDHERERNDLKNPEVLNKTVVDLWRLTGAKDTPILRYVAALNLVQKEIVSTGNSPQWYAELLEHRHQLTLDKTVTPQEIYQFLQDFQQDSALFPYVETLETLYVEMLLRLKEKGKNWPTTGDFKGGSAALTQGEIYETLFKNLLQRGGGVTVLLKGNVATQEKTRRKLYTVLLVHLLGEKKVSQFGEQEQNRFRASSFEGESYDIGPDSAIQVWLQGADLSFTNLRGADLHTVNLCKTNLQGANLHRANLDRAQVGHGQAKRLSRPGYLAVPLTQEQLKQLDVDTGRDLLAQVLPALLSLPYLYELEGWEVGLVHLLSAAVIGLLFLGSLYFSIWLNQYWLERATQQQRAEPTPTQTPAPMPHSAPELRLAPPFPLEIAL